MPTPRPGLVGHSCSHTAGEVGSGSCPCRRW
jgi:hypothetical protein